MIARAPRRAARIADAGLAARLFAKRVAVGYARHGQIVETVGITID